MKTIIGFIFFLPFLFFTNTLDAQQTKKVCEAHSLQETVRILERRGTMRSSTYPPMVVPPNWEAELGITQQQLEETLIIPLKFHVSVNSSGEWSVSQAEIDLAISNLTNLFRENKFEFVQCGAVDVINIPELDQIDNTQEYFAFQDNSAIEDGVINLFIPRSAPPYTATGSYPFITPNNYVSCFMTRSHFIGKGTLYHELGHNFGLYHTHEPSDIAELEDLCEQIPNMHVSTHELVIRHVDPNAQNQVPNCAYMAAGDPNNPYGVELLAGDLLCGTEADPNLLSNSDCDQRIDVNTPDYKGIIGENPDGTPIYLVDLNDHRYTPNLDNIMSYITDQHKTNFTEDQYDRMLYFYFKYQDRFYDGTSCPPAPDTRLIAEEVLRRIGSSRGINNVNVQLDYYDSNNCDPSTYDTQGDCGPHLTDGDGIFSCTIFPTGSFSYTLSKPTAWADGITGTDYGDIDLLAAFITGLEPLNGHQQIAADVNLSGHISINDLVIIRKFLLGIRTTPEELPSGDLVATEWRFYSEIVRDKNRPQFNSNYYYQTNPFDIGGIYAYPGYLSSELIGTSSLCLEAGLYVSNKLGFHGVKVGDLDGSIALPNFRPGDDSQDRSEAPLSTINKQNIPAGSRVKLAIKGRGFTNISTFQMGLRIPEEQFEVLRIESPHLPNFDAEAYNLDYPIKDVYPIAWFNLETSGSSLTEDQPILIIELLTKTAISNSSELATMAGPDFKTGFMRQGQQQFVELFGDLVEVQTPSDYWQPMSVRHFPDPVKDQLNLEVQLGEAGPLDVQVYDAYGRLLSSRRLAGQMGSNRFTFDLAAERWPAGLLYYTLEGQGQRATGRFVKSR
ncbi:MAG: hypothetical protein AAGG75_04240 [Bacteroidota bacterium]